MGIVKLTNGSEIHFSEKPQPELKASFHPGWTYVIGYGWIEGGEEDSERTD